MRLLELNRSVDRKSDITDYKMAKPLPKFAPAKRPVSLAPNDKFKTVEKDMSTTPSLFENREPNTPVANSTNDPVPGVLSVGVFPSGATRPVVEKKSIWARLSSVFSRKKEKAPTRAVQTEWSLDKVTVVRNDLLDDDLEVVLKTSPVSEAAKSEKRKIVGSAWRREEVKTENSEPVTILK